MFAPVWWYFFQQSDMESLWTVFLPALADWEVDEPEMGGVLEVQE